MLLSAIARQPLPNIFIQEATPLPSAFPQKKGEFSLQGSWSFPPSLSSSFPAPLPSFPFPLVLTSSILPSLSSSSLASGGPQAACIMSRSFFSFYFNGFGEQCTLCPMCGLLSQNGEDKSEGQIPGSGSASLGHDRGRRGEAVNLGEGRAFSAPFSPSASRDWHAAADGPGPVAALQRSRAGLAS